MENKQVLAKEELDQLKDIQELYSKIITELGQIDLQVNNLEKTIDVLLENRDNILKEYDIMQEKEKQLGNHLSIKYGDGTIDSNTGEFTPKQ